MTDEVAIAKDSLDVLSVIFELGSTFSQIAGIISFSGPLAAAFSVVGAILGLIGGLLPDVNHQELLGRFNQLSNKIDLVRNDIHKLRNELGWDITEAQYGDAVDRIELGIEYCLDIGKVSGEKEKKWYQNELKKLCDNGNCALAMKTLLDGMTGSGNFRSSGILDKFYDKTGGHRRDTSALATRLLQLTCGGMMVITTYGTMMHGKEGAPAVTKRFYDRLNEARRKVQSVLDTCVKNFRDNMLNDLNGILDEGGSNKGLLTKITNFMSDKYDWLENFVLVYNDLYGSDNHCFNGQRVDSLHRNGKCGIVFYRTKGEPPRFSDRYGEARKIVDTVDYCAHAERCYDNIVSKINQRGIEWSGCAVIRRSQDLCVGGNFSTKLVHIDKYQIIGGWFFGTRVKTVDAILLLK